MIDRIKQYNLCLGCGLCSSLLGNDKCTMQLGKDGFYFPQLNGSLTKKESKLVKNTCPAVKVIGKPHKGKWGPIKSISQAWSADKEIRFKAASGGVVTSLGICLLEHKMVDAILQVGVCGDSYLYNELHISRTKEDVEKNAQSRYAPALVFHKIKEIFDSENSVFALIGKPCDMAAMQNFIREYPQYKERVKYYISIFCAGMPSYNATIEAWKISNRKDEPVSLKYRGDGWPGNFMATFSDGSNFKLSYNESWGKILGRQIGFRCKVCPDGIGMLADISVGDSWNTKNGYPDFIEDEGRCFCMVRTERGAQLLETAFKNQYITCKTLDISKVEEQQPYQLERRRIEGWRVLAVQLYTCGIFNFRGLSIWNQMLSSNIIKGAKNMIGTFLRIHKMHGKQYTNC